MFKIQLLYEGLWGAESTLAVIGTGGTVRLEFGLGERPGKTFVFPPGKKRIRNREKLRKTKLRETRTISRIVDAL
eukprot:392987-Prorocentrum_minimum.AAC.2